VAREAAIGEVTAAAYEIPTDQPEGDGTLAWSSTVLVVVRARAGDVEGLGWTYAARAAAVVVEEKLAGVVEGRDALDVPGANEAMLRACRNLGQPGVAACAISAVDVALWDLKARLLDVPLAGLVGRARDEVPVYGSGGFTSYDDDTTRAQLEHWVRDWDLPRVKIKIGQDRGRDERRDLHRVGLARQVVGDGVELYVDANGAYSRKQAIRVGRAMDGRWSVTWFEEPVSSDDLAGLREVRDQCAIDVAAGEYGWSPWYFAPMLAAGAVDCVQADITRCGGVTGWLAVGHLARAHQLEISGHCAPNLHAHVALGVTNLRHLEYFHDHVRIEDRLFDGTLSPVGGSLRPRRDVTGHGMSFRAADAEQYRVG
jgi:L-alanine-DL-glutamate epimerase-like enolase superfamily enzyme